LKNLKHIFNLLPDAINRMPDHCKGNSHQKVCNQIIDLKRKFGKRQRSERGAIRNAHANFKRLGARTNHQEEKEKEGDTTGSNGAAVSGQYAEAPR